MEYIELLGVDSTTFKPKLIQVLSSVPNDYSINELTEMFTDADIRYIPERRGEGDVTLANYEETFNRLGWRATYDLLEWINKHE